MLSRRSDRSRPIALGGVLPLAALAILWAPLVRAAPEPAPQIDGELLALEWHGSEHGCDAANVKSEALRLLGSSPLRRIAASAQVWRDGDEWIVQLDTRSAVHTGRRILRSQSCEDLRQAIALLLAMILESEADPDDVELPSDAPAPRRPRDGEDATDPGIDLLLNAGAHASAGLKPELAWGLSGAAGLQWRHWEAWLRFVHWPRTRASFGSAGYVEIERQNVGISLCAGIPMLEVWELLPCISPELTLFGYRAVNIAEANEERVKPLLSLSGSVDLRYWLPGQWLFAQIGGGVTWEKPQPFEIRYDCEPEGQPECTPMRVPVYETDGLGPRFTFVVGARF